MGSRRYFTRVISFHKTSMSRPVLAFGDHTDAEAQKVNGREDREPKPGATQARFELHGPARCYARLLFPEDRRSRNSSSFA
jgi:hypothetical protein